MEQEYKQSVEITPVTPPEGNPRPRITPATEVDTVSPEQLQDRATSQQQHDQTAYDIVLEELQKEAVGETEDEVVAKTEEKDDLIQSIEQFLQEQPVSKETDLEEGFTSVEAQKAYHDYIDSIHALNIQTGEGIESVEVATKDIEATAAEMSLTRILELMSVTLNTLLALWMIRGITAEDEEEQVTSEKDREKKQELSVKDLPEVQIDKVLFSMN